MVKLYIKENEKGIDQDEKGRFLNINILSFVKVQLISSMIIGLCIYTLGFLVGFFYNNLIY